MSKAIYNVCLIACTIVAFLCTYKFGRAVRHLDVLAIFAYALLLGPIIWIWFKVRHGRD